MKITKILYHVLLLSFLLFLGSAGQFGVHASGAEWTSEDSIDILADGNVKVTGAGDNLFSAQYSGPLDFNSGNGLSYYLSGEDSMSIGEEMLVFERPDSPSNPGSLINNARRFDHSFVKFTIINEGGEGLEVAFYHQRADYSENQPNKIEINLTYLSPRIKAEAGGLEKTQGKHYTETLYSFENNFGQWHTFSCYKYNGAFYISADGTTFVPMPEYGYFDLSEAIVTVNAKAMQKDLPNIILSQPSTEIDKVTFGDWATLGESIISLNADGTTRLELKEKSELLHSGTLYLRERVFNVKGCSIYEPIVIEYSHQVYNSPSLFFGVSLASSPYEMLLRRKTANFGRGSIVEDCHSFAYWDLKGLAVYSSLGAVQNSSASGSIERGTLFSFGRNSVDIYDGNKGLDRVEYRINDEYTSVYVNGEWMFDDVRMKASDFPDGKAYPYFVFLENPANSTRTNILNLKGVNAPFRQSPFTIKYDAQSLGDLDISLDVYGQQAALYEDMRLEVPIEKTLYSLDAANGVLTVKKGFFEGKSYGIYEIFVAIKNGVERVPIRFMENINEQKYALLNSDTIFYEKGNSRDINFFVGVKGLSFTRIYGAGLYIGDSLYDTRTEKAIIRASALRDLEYGTYKLNFETIDDYGEIYTTPFTLRVVKTAPKTVVERIEFTDSPLFYIAAVGSALILAGVIVSIYLRLKNKARARKHD